jgi:hypothetical protein
MSDLALGQLITDQQQRDAIHIAVAPVIAAEAMEPGQHIQLDADGKACSGKKPIGIVDPFLKKDVMPGEHFWLFMYPKTVTNLRHEWSHPAFVKKDDAAKMEAIKWMEDAASQLEITYDELIRAAMAFQKTGEYLGVGFDTPELFHTDGGMEKFWTYYEIITGEKAINKSDGFVSCAC